MTMESLNPNIASLEDKVTELVNIIESFRNTKAHDDPEYSNTYHGYPKEDPAQMQLNAFSPHFNQNPVSPLCKPFLKL